MKCYTLTFRNCSWSMHRWMCDFCYGTELRAQLVGRASYIMYVCVVRVCMCVGIYCMQRVSLMHTQWHIHTRLHGALSIGTFPTTESTRALLWTAGVWMYIVVGVAQADQSICITAHCSHWRVYPSPNSWQLWVYSSPNIYTCIPVGFINSLLQGPMTPFIVYQLTRYTSRRVSSPLCPTLTINSSLDSLVVMFTEYICPTPVHDSAVFANA